MDISVIIVGILAGAITGVIFLFLLRRNTQNDSSASLVKELEKNKSRQEGLIEGYLEKIDRLEAEVGKGQTDRTRFITEYTRIKTEKEGLQEKLMTQKQELEELQKKFTTEFENIANKILEDKSQKFTNQNKANLDQILKPLGEKIKDFEKKVEDRYVDGAKGRAALLEQIKTMSDLNHKMREEASNLTKALKGDNKVQGNWGELILERILESSGLNKSQEYFTQESTINDQGKRIQPDVVVKLPDNKHVIIDSKVSLIAYEAYVNGAQEDQELHLKNHLLSVKNHIKGLHEKNYQSGEKFNTPDFVLLFIPIEASFGIAVQADQELQRYAWERKIVLVSPSTLLATLRTIASVWKQEHQNRNVMEIARLAGTMYDKFEGFIEDMQKIKRGVDSSNEAFDKAMNKLKDGKGNLISTAEKIKKLGAKANKQIDAKHIVTNELPSEE